MPKENPKNIFYAHSLSEHRRVNIGNIKMGNRTKIFLGAFIAVIFSFGFSGEFKESFFGNFF